MDKFVKTLYQSKNTVFNTKDLTLVWRITDAVKLKNRIAYCIKSGYLLRLTRGVFAKNKEYSSKELATSLYTPSYISFETVLREAGMIFQYYETIYLAGPWSKTVSIGKNTFTFRKIKDRVLYNPSGIINDGNTSQATPERAFLDTLYVSPRYYFDNIRPINWEVCFELVKIYNNQQLVKRLKKLYDNIQ